MNMAGSLNFDERVKNSDKIVFYLHGFSPTPEKFPNNCNFAHIEKFPEKFP